MTRAAKAAAVVLAVALTAPASTAAFDPTALDHYVDADGRGTLIANPGDGATVWERCLPGAPCTPFAPNGETPDIVHVDDEPAGTVFQATKPDGVLRRSEAWQGPVRAVTPPILEGDVRVGGVVRARPGAWQGGWGRERDHLQVQACPTATADAGCLVLLDSVKYADCGTGDGRVLPERYAGWYLRVANSRFDREQPFTAEGYSQPEGIRPKTAAGAVAVVTVGPIGAGRPPRSDCGTSAWVTMRKGITRAPTGRYDALRVTCFSRCRVDLQVRQSRRAFTVRRTLRKGTTTVALPRDRVRRHLRPGAVRLALTINTRTYAVRTATLRR